MITTEPNDFMQDYHHRMPVFLDSEDKLESYLEQKFDHERINNILKSHPSEKMEAITFEKGKEGIKNLLEKLL